jgi:hypothetical protein
MHLYHLIYLGLSLLTFLPLIFIFQDSFDHYTVVTDKYDVANNGVIQTGGINSRTGIGNVSITGAFGPQKNLAANVSNFLLCLAWNSSASGDVMLFQNLLADVGFNATCVRLSVAADLSLLVRRGPDAGSTTLGQTGPGLVVLNTYNSIAMQSVISPTGSVNVWCNGVLVLALTNVNTAHPFGGGNIVDAFTLMGPGGLPNCYIDDVYALDCSASPHTTFLGALKVYAEPPVANAAPLQWTPLASTNWVEVSENPPDNDTSYNSDSTIGDTDQYVYNSTGVPGSASILSVAHDLDMRVDVGSRTVGSVLNNAAAQNPIALTNGYHIYQTLYDNPAPTFPANFGPKVTA